MRRILGSGLHRLELGLPEDFRPDETLLEFGSELAALGRLRRHQNDPLFVTALRELVCRRAARALPCGLGHRETLEAAARLLYQRRLRAVVAAPQWTGVDVDRPEPAPKPRIARPMKPIPAPRPKVPEADPLLAEAESQAAMLRSAARSSAPLCEVCSPLRGARQPPAPPRRPAPPPPAPPPEDFLLFEPAAQAASLQQAARTGAALCNPCTAAAGDSG